jgi:hypothetical protein
MRAALGVVLTTSALLLGCASTQVEACSAEAIAWHSREAARLCENIDFQKCPYRDQIMRRLESELEQCSRE